jgi:hypothetical protein
MRVVERLNKLLFDVAVRGMESTPVVGPGNVPIIALSMVQKRDVRSYLLAVKTFLHQVPAARLVVIADPTLDADCRRVLSLHLPHIEFREAVEFRHPAIPKGGCWERLAAIAQYVAEGYVIQLDADTVTLGPLAAVNFAVNDGVAFTLGTEDSHAIVSCEEISSWARARLKPNSHIQVVAESKLAGIEGAHELRYIRGCAGFAGYPQASFDPQRLYSFSERMRSLMPDKWDLWGSEQFASNVLVASMPGARILPHPDYCAPDQRQENCVFLHFIGYVRYTTTLYAKVARQSARELRAAA